jgi:CheY-like chemotaxis protein
VTSKPIFGNWMVAVAEAAEVAGAPNLDGASADQMDKAWDLVRRTADVTRAELMDAIAREARIPVAELGVADPRAEILIPAEVAHRRNVLPLDCTDREIGVATCNPLSQEAKREIQTLTGRTVRFELAGPQELHAAVTAAYGPRGPTEETVHVDTFPPTGPHILVADDEAGQRELFRSILEKDGYRVTVARDGPEALDALRSDDTVDLVTLDYLMEKMNGLRVLQHIRSDKAIRNVPVIMVTGAGDRQIEMSLF